jgi:drug/metabolite transporter (DMT)-like permease
VPVSSEPVKKLNAKVLKADILLGLTACIWGFAFSAQRAGMDHVGPFTFNAVRFLLGGVSLLPLILFGKKPRQTGGKANARLLAVYSVIAGGCLFAGASLQQAGLFWTTAGNCGFLTGIYVILVPIFGIFLGRKTGLPTWAGAALALAGLFFIIGGVRFDTINRGDLLSVISSVFWTAHVLLIDRFVRKADALKLSCGQFLVCGILSGAAALLDFAGLLGVKAGAEIGSLEFELSLLFDAAVPILYGGICSVGIAYTLQVVAQQYAPPAHAAIILCMESVFAAVGGMLLLSERPGASAILGFALVFSGMVAAQLDAAKPISN